MFMPVILYGVGTSRGTGEARQSGERSELPVLESVLDTTSDTYAANRAGSLELLAEHDRQLAIARAGGGERYRERHRARGKLLVRERIELLLDADTAFLELSPLAAYGTDFHVGASCVTGVGVVSGVECVISANDPTVRGGSSNPYTLRKSLRALEIARENRLPVINLVESGGADLPTQADIFVPGGQSFRDLTRLSAAGIPTIALVFGNSTAGGAYVPGMCDYAVMVDRAAKVFLGGPPLVKMATGEDAEDEELGGAEMHARVSGLADYLAVDETDCIRIGRQIVADLNWRKRGPAPSRSADDPAYDPDELLGVVSSELRVPFDPLEVIARVVDGSRFDEYKPTYGTSLVTGWASIHGYPIGILANSRGVLFMDESKKATEFILLANQIDAPLLFLHNTTGYMVGKQYEQAGMVKDGSKMINAVSNSGVPHLSVIMGASYGAGNYGMCGRAFGPRFLFTWPGAKVAVMGPTQLAGVLSIVGRQAAEATGKAYSEEEDALRRQFVEAQIEREQAAMFMTGKCYDDGIIDPRDTRTALGIALSAVHSQVVEGRTGYGVFRM
jgi:acetyl-CoA carboxylase carboxyltransferase component